MVGNSYNDTLSFIAYIYLADMTYHQPYTIYLSDMRDEWVVTLLALDRPRHPGRIFSGFAESAI